MKVKISETVPCSSQQCSLGSHGGPRPRYNSAGQRAFQKTGKVKHEAGVWKTIASAVHAMAGHVAQKQKEKTRC